MPEENIFLFFSICRIKANKQVQTIYRLFVRMGKKNTNNNNNTMKSLIFEISIYGLEVSPEK